MSLPLSFIPATWRRNQMPPCPWCGRGVVLEHHRGCKAVGADLYIDLSTGWVHCAGCGVNYGVERWHHFCNCGAVYEGGELWQGMAVEVGQAAGWQDDHFTQAAWFKTAMAERGSVETKALGWWLCAFCGAKRESDFFQKGGRKGGLCDRCDKVLLKAFKAGFTWRVTFKPCQWLGHELFTSRLRIVKYGKERICQACFKTISNRWFSLDNW